MTIHNISFNKIQSYKSDVTDQMNQILDSEWMQKYGIKVHDVSLRINASDESRKIIQEVDAEVSRTTRMGQVYSNNMAGTMAAASAEAMKNAASNPNGSMMGFMGMGFAQQQGTNMMASVNGMPQQENVQPQQPQPSVMPGAVFQTQPEQATQPQAEENNVEETQNVSEQPSALTKKFCTQCGTEFFS